MSLSHKDPPNDTLIPSSEVNVSQELSQANKNNALLLTLLHKGIENGGFSLCDVGNASVIRAIAENVCNVTQYFINHSGSTTRNQASGIPVPAIEFRKCDKSPLTDSVHNSDVTNDDDIAYEPMSTHWVSEFGEEVDDEHRTTLNSFDQSYPSADNNKKRKPSSIDEEKERNKRRQKEGYERSSSIVENAPMRSIANVMDYTSLHCCRQGTNKSNTAIDRNIALTTFITDVINACSNNNECPYHAQCLVILEHSPNAIVIDSDASEESTGSNNSRLFLNNYFDKCVVAKMTVIERPHDKCQVYVAKDLGKYFHFSCPTADVCQLYDAIKSRNNSTLEILFIPNACKVFDSENVRVCNGIDVEKEYFFDASNFTSLLEIVHDSAKSSSASDHKSKRSSKSISIGLQTMYSHQQHASRYCMLPHSFPFVPTVKNHQIVLRKNILEVYSFSSKVLSSHFKVNEETHPFSLTLKEPGSCGNVGHIRTGLRDDMQKVLYCDDINTSEPLIPTNIMFESCTVQQAGQLGFHRDTLNCPHLDRTVAVHIPNNNDSKSCLSFLYYSRKCVGDYSNRIQDIERFITSSDDMKICDLTRLCLKSLLEMEGIFNYQGSLFENIESLNDIGQRLEVDPSYACPEVTTFTGLTCFKHGAAFDKMGYYSVFLNVFLSMHYLELITTIDDALSLCIYFGLCCNGTTNIAATWKDIEQNLTFAQEWVSKKGDKTRIFRLLIILEKRRRLKSKSKDLIGCCKLPRFQYANYSANIIEDAELIHRYVKDFLLKCKTKARTTQRNARGHHSMLFKILSSVKGIGPLSFNQFWHSLCLSGILPVSYIQTIAVAPGSGPAKLIQTFYPSCKTAEALYVKLTEVKGKISKLGIHKVTEFFLENQMCELWRLGMRSKVVTKLMTDDNKRAGFRSDDFHRAMVISTPTKNPDIYFQNPFTKQYQHLFRVCDKESLVMRPSFLANSDSRSSTLTCDITYSDEKGILLVKWNGDYVRKGDKTASDWFS